MSILSFIVLIYKETTDSSHIISRDERRVNFFGFNLALQKVYSTLNSPHKFSVKKTTINTEM